MCVGFKREILVKAYQNKKQYDDVYSYLESFHLDFNILQKILAEKTGWSTFLLDNMSACMYVHRYLVLLYFILINGLFYIPYVSLYWIFTIKK